MRPAARHSTHNRWVLQRDKNNKRTTSTCNRAEAMFKLASNTKPGTACSFMTLKQSESLKSYNVCAFCGVQRHSMRNRCVPRHLGLDWLHNKHFQVCVINSLSKTGQPPQPGTTQSPPHCARKQWSHSSRDAQKPAAVDGQPQPSEGSVGVKFRSSPKARATEEEPPAAIPVSLTSRD